MKNYYLLFIASILIISCSKKESEFEYVEEPIVTKISIDIRADKAKYIPGEQVNFTVNNFSSEIKLRYKYLNKIIFEEQLSGSSWTWTPPTVDFRGYMIEAIQIINGEENIVGTIGLDVSSDWTKFPRYGFLSKFGNISKNESVEIINNLKNYHINGLQFYDWHNKHHAPLKMDGLSPASSWKDIANRDCYFNTVENYIEIAKSNNMASMSYNLLYGAWEDFKNDNISETWMLYNDVHHQVINKHILPDSWASDLLLVNPVLNEWQDYIFDKTRLIYNNLDFDGWHLDQLGDRGVLYDYNGNAVNLKQSFTGFLNNLKQSFPNKKLVLNAVNQYGNSEILKASVNFAYSEVWSPNESFSDLANIINANSLVSNNQLNTVLAAYMNYNLANNSGFFNEPSVLLTDAVIFSFGGSHLELGEHMLSKEYFPNNNLLMKTSLKDKLLKYYDFLVAYQNVLRDGGTFNYPEINSSDGKININNWPPIVSKVATFGKEFSDKQIVHFINFSEAIHTNWRDSMGEQNYPISKKDMLLSIATNKTVSKVWFASPDINGGASQELSFQVNGSKINLKLPYLEYWSMIIIEY